MPSPGFRSLLAERPLLLDGGLGSLLIAAGLEKGRAPEWWVLERPERLQEAHRAYAEAGSDVVHACTFGGSPPKLKASGLQGRCKEISARAISIARKAAGEGILVAGDVGPTGLLRPPLGQASPEEFEAAFAGQAQALAEGGADLLSVETMYDLKEALAALAAAKETGLPVCVSMTFEKRKRGFFTIMGDALGPSLLALAQAGADAVGCNCSVTSDVMLEMVREAVPLLSVPMAAQPNAGQPRVSGEGIVYDASLEGFARDLAAMAKVGARLVGGCCGTTPDFIRLARGELEAGGFLRARRD